MTLLALFLISLALVVFWLARHQRKATGLPGGRIIYEDTRRWSRLEKPLYMPDLGLTGKPDYLIDQEGLVIPVEVKSSRKLPEAPYDSHIYQLAAYCILVEYTFKKRPTYGILHYTQRNTHGRTFAIDFTVELEQAVRSTVEAIRNIHPRRNLDRSHQSPARCTRCGYRQSCDQSLA